MTSDDLMKEVDKFHRRFASTWGEIIEYPKVMNTDYIDWGNISYVDGDKVLDFLNKWGQCRRGRGLTSDLVGKLTLLAPLLKPVRSLTLEEAEFDSLIEVGDERLRISHVIHLSFDELMSIKGFGPVPASKALHMVSPGLFVMWDNNICKHYGLRLCAFDYAYRFLPRMRAEADEAIRDTMTKNECDRETAIARIRDRGQQIWGVRKTIAKLIDEHNWSASHR